MRKPSSSFPGMAAASPWSLATTGRVDASEGYFRVRVQFARETQAHCVSIAWPLLFETLRRLEIDRDHYVFALKAAASGMRKAEQQRYKSSAAVRDRAEQLLKDPAFRQAVATVVESPSPADLPPPKPHPSTPEGKARRSAAEAAALAQGPVSAAEFSAFMLSQAAKRGARNTRKRAKKAPAACRVKAGTGAEPDPLLIMARARAVLDMRRNNTAN